jgi:hypothetical protein
MIHGDSLLSHFPPERTIPPITPPHIECEVGVLHFSDCSSIALFYEVLIIHDGPQRIAHVAARMSPAMLSAPPCRLYLSVVVGLASKPRPIDTRPLPQNLRRTRQNHPAPLARVVGQVNLGNNVPYYYYRRGATDGARRTRARGHPPVPLDGRGHRPVPGVPRGAPARRRRLPAGPNPGPSPGPS